MRKIFDTIRNAGLAAATDTLVVFLDSVDRLIQGTLQQCSEAMLRSQTDMGISQFQVGIGAGHVHLGVHDSTVVAELSS